MSEIDFLAVSAILMIISDFYWYWLLISSYCVFVTGNSTTVSPIGQCPEISDSPDGSCFTYNSTCLSDEQCFSGFLCCFDGCRLTCLPSVGAIDGKSYCCHCCCSCYGCIWLLGQHGYKLISYKYMLLAGWEVRIGKNWDRGLENAFWSFFFPIA